MLFKYQFLTLGRISEVSGKYTPHKDQYRIVDVDGEPFVMFIVKTAKRKGYLRPCGRPLNPVYEPWTREVVDYMRNGSDYPFLLHENRDTSKTYAMNYAKKTFKGLYFPYNDYTKQVKRPYTQDMVKHKRWGDDGYEEYLVIFPDGERRWTKDLEYASISEKVNQRWKKMTSHGIRKIGAQTLINDYGFEPIDAAYVGGWTVTGQQTGVSSALGKFYLHMDLRESEAALPQLEKIMLRYARKLLVPYATFI